MATDGHQKWADRQIATLLDLGIDLADAQRSVQFVLDNMPQDADPDTWIPPAEMLEHDPSSPESVQDARAAWYASDGVPGRYKRLLDAREEKADE
jgi:hypothetical protein